jgi:hypothetical protein
MASFPWDGGDVGAARAVAGSAEAGDDRAAVTDHGAWVFTSSGAWASSRVLPAVQAAGTPEAWRRHLGFLLDGFRAERASPLPEPPLSPRQVYRAMVVLGRRSAGATDPHRR